MARHGHRIAHIAEIDPGEAVSDLIDLPVSGPKGANAPSGVRPAALSFSRERREGPRTASPQPALGLPIYDLAAVGVVIAGAAMASLALLLF